MTPEWLVSPEPVLYEEALARMEARVAAIRTGTEPELLWLLEHPPLYTAGTSARKEVGANILITAPASA
jgi:lipoyl(octanoyl) transferase